MKNTLIILTILSLITSCGGTSENNTHHPPTAAPSNSNKLNVVEDIQKLTINETSDNVNLRSILNIENLISLETNPQSLLGTINKVAVFNDLLLVLDSRNTKKLAVFNIKGKHLYNIGSNGDGPDQYRGILDFATNSKRNQVYILDREMNLIIYNINGKFIDRKPIKISINSIGILGENLIALYSDSGTKGLPNGDVKLKIYDIDKEQIVSKHLGTNPAIEDRIVSNNKNISSYESAISLYTSSTDTIYQIKKNTLIAKYVLDFKNKPRPRGFLETLPLMPRGYQVLLESGYPSSPLSWEENTESIYFRFARNNKFYYNIHDKKTLSSIMCTSNISDNFFMGIDIEPVGNLKNQFILSIDPGNIAMIRNHYKNNNQSDKIKYPSKFKDLLESVEADQNALLAIVTIKN